MPLSISDCPADRVKQLRAFVARMYRATYPLAVDEALLRWQFGGPRPPADRLCVKIADVDTQIAGMLGYVPVELTIGGEIVPAAWPVNWMVDPSRRGLGIGRQLMQAVVADTPVVLTAGPNEDARTLLSRMGWIDVGPLARHVRVLDAEKAASLTAGGRLPAGPDDRPALGFRAQDVAAVATFDEEATELWDRQSEQDGTGGTRRSAAYLNWRYANHPRFRYRLVVARRRGRLTGFAVSRLEQARHDGVPAPELRVVRILELVASDQAAIALLDAITEEASADGAAVIDFFCASGKLRPALSRSGFFPGDHPRAAAIPLVFQPVDHRRTGIRFMLSLGPKAGVTVEHWYVTKGDADQDRPN